MTCYVPSCNNADILQWQRWATPAEVDQYHASGDLPLHETTALLAVYSCDTHKLSPAILMTVPHDSDCGAPPCDCSVSENPPDPAGGEDEGHAL